MKNLGDTIRQYRVVWKQDVSTSSESYIVERSQEPGTLYVLRLWPEIRLTGQQDSSDFPVNMSTLKNMYSRYILPLEGFGSDEEDHPYLVLPYEITRQEKLSERLRRGPLSADEAERVLTDVGSALVLAHQQGLVHGLLSPECVLLNAQGQASLYGFCSSALDSREARRALPPLYCFPEGRASRLGDQYALAGLAQELLQKPGSAERDASELRQALARAQEQEPARRFPGVREFLAQLGISLPVERRESELEPQPPTLAESAPVYSRVSANDSTQTQVSAPQAETPQPQSGTWGPAPIRPARPRLSKKQRRRRAWIALACLLLCVCLVVLHIELPASAATVTLTPASQTLKQSYTLSGGEQTNLAAHQVQTRALTYKTSVKKKTARVQNKEHIPATSAKGEVVFTRISGDIDLSFYDLTINIGNGLSLTVDDTTTDMRSGHSYTEPVTVDQTGTQGNIPAGVVDGTYQFMTEGTTAYIYNPKPFHGGTNTYDGPVVSASDTSPIESDFLQQEQQEAMDHFKGQLQPGEGLLNNFSCTQNNREQPAIDSRAANVTVTSSATCQVEAYDQQGLNTALLNAAHDLAMSTFDAHFALVHPATITILNPGVPGSNVSIDLTVQSTWRLLLDGRGTQAVQQALAGLSQDDAKALLQNHYKARVTDLNLNWWWGGHMPADPSAIKLVAHYPAT